MTLDIEQRLESDLTALAERTPWASGDADVVRRAAHLRRRRRTGMRCVLVVAALAATLVIFDISGRHRVGRPVQLLNAPVPVPPAGREVPLELWSDPTPDDWSTRTRVSLLVDGNTTLSLKLEAYFLHGFLQRYACLAVDGGGMCDGAIETDDGTATAHLPRFGGSDRLLFWTGLPASTAFVELATPGGSLWQRPIDGVVAFPVDGWDNLANPVAFDASGAEVDRIDPSTPRQVEVSGGDGSATWHYYSSTPVVRGGGVNMQWDALTSEQRTAREELATVLMDGCVGDDASIDLWEGCLDSVNADLQRAAGADGAFTVLLGRPAPTVVAETTHGQSIDLTDRAGHWLVLSFGATSCQPCTDQLDALREFRDQQVQRDDGAELYTVATGPTFDDARSFYDAHGVTWPVLVDTDARIQAAFGVARIPETWIIDPIGNVVLRTTTADTADQLTRYLEQLQAGR